MNGTVTERFIECVNLIKEQENIPSSGQFAKLLDLHPQCLSDIKTGKRKVNADLIGKMVHNFNINANYLFTGSGDHFSADAEAPAAPIVQEQIITVVTDNQGSERIVHVPYAAQAGYVDQFHDPIYMQELPAFSLPDQRFSTGTHRCFDVSGDSMEPTIFSGEKVVCSYVEQDLWKTNIRNNYVYVVVTDSGIVLKRVVNNLNTNGELIIKSDNSFYDLFSLPITSIREVWLVTHKISPFMPSPSNIRNALHKEVDNLRVTIADQGKMILSLNSTIEKMLKQNRQLSVR